MCRIAKIKLLMKTMLCATFITMFAVSDVWAQAFTPKMANTKLDISERNCRNIKEMEKYVAKVKNYPIHLRITQLYN